MQVYSLGSTVCARASSNCKFAYLNTSNTGLMKLFCLENGAHLCVVAAGLEAALLQHGSAHQVGRAMRHEARRRHPLHRP